MTPTPAQIEFLEAARALLNEKDSVPPALSFSSRMPKWAMDIGPIEAKVCSLLMDVGTQRMMSRMYQRIYSAQPLVQNPRLNGIYGKLKS